MNKYIYFILLLISGVSIKAQYITKVIEYSPAPGQFINLSPWGTPSSANSIVGGVNGTLNLGAFGGYVVFRFDSPVENNPDNPYGVDFTIFGNPLPDWSEPAVVYVMKDENQNNLPDDTWYEIAGSDYFFSSTTNNYEVTYTNPNQSVASDVFWTDNQGNSGYLYANTYYTQPYYPLADSFPQISQDYSIYSGTKIQPNLDFSNPAFFKSYKRAFGYVDNQFRGYAPYTLPDNPYTQEVENSGGDAFDISWAVDTNGNYIDLDVIHFVKVQNSIVANAGILGEISPEITGAVDVEPNSSITGNMDIIVIKDLPKIINSATTQLEVFYFHDGRLVPNSEIDWECNMSGAIIDENNILTVNSSGQIELTAYLSDDHDVRSSVATSVDLTLDFDIFTNEIEVFPNPATDYFKIKNADDYYIELVDLQGNVLLKIENYTTNQVIDLTNLTVGIYFIKATKNGKSFYDKLVIY